MTREDVARTLRMMERCRELSYEASTKREERRLVKEYAAMHAAIKPFISGEIPYTGEKA